MWASAAGGNRFLILNSPFYVYGISYLDVVSIIIEDGLNRYDHVVDRGGHSTYRIFLVEEKSLQKFDEYWGALKSLGCTFERGTDYLVAVDVPPEADIY
jgi:hypothetical protein